MSDTTRWTVSVTRETDTAVRCFLAQRGLKEGDLSKLVEEAVRWRALKQTITEIRGNFADLPTEELQMLVGEVVPAVHSAAPSGGGSKQQQSRFAALRGRAGLGLSTDQIMALTRGKRERHAR
ncbi:MAG TPA: ribbon-helix-helix domain-containing protein [Acetobacteraceae bacterium]